MKKALIIYYKENEKTKYSNEEITACELEKKFAEKGIIVKKFELTPVKISGNGKKERFLPREKKQGKEIEIKFNKKPPIVSGYDYVIIGSPIVGSLTSAPAVNAYLRSIPKNSQNQNKVFALYTTGIMPGFALKKMQSLLSMNGIKASHLESFTSIFEFDTKKKLEIERYFKRIIGN